MTEDTRKVKNLFPILLVKTKDKQGYQTYHPRNISFKSKLLTSCYWKHERQIRETALLDAGIKCGWKGGHKCIYHWTTGQKSFLSVLMLLLCALETDNTQNESSRDRH